MTDYQTIKTRLEGDIAYLQIHRPDDNNTINEQLIIECTQALDVWSETAKIVILEGLPDVFCFGADFKEIAATYQSNEPVNQDPEPLYDLWLKLAQGPFISIASVQAKVNAGGVGFVAACDIVLAERSVVFSLSELLFSLMPACVLPFLINKVGFQKAHYMTMMTQPVSAEKARDMGLVDVIGDDCNDLLRKHLLRLRLLSKEGISRYKEYMVKINNFLTTSKTSALEANKEIFSDQKNLESIHRYITTGKFPWE